MGISDTVSNNSKEQARSAAKQDNETSRKDQEQPSTCASVQRELANTDLLPLFPRSSGIWAFPVGQTGRHASDKVMISYSKVNYRDSDIIPWAQ